MVGKIPRSYSLTARRRLTCLLINKGFASHLRQVYTVGPSGTVLLMWAATGNHGAEWTYADVILSNPAPFRVIFQVEVGGDMWTDIALDDVSYTEECVSEGEDQASSTGPLVRIQFSDPSSCGFHLPWSPPPHISCPPSVFSFPNEAAV